MEGFLDYFEANYAGGVRLSHKDRDQLLAPFANDPNAYVSFTSVLKLGVNPRSKYNTPVGIYAYPIGYALDHFGDGEFNVPFANDRPLMVAFRCLYPEKVLIFKPGPPPRQGVAQLDPAPAQKMYISLVRAYEQSKQDFDTLDPFWRFWDKLANQLRTDLGSDAESLERDLEGIIGGPGAELKGGQAIREAYKNLAGLSVSYPLEDRVRGLRKWSEAEYGDFKNEVLAPEQRMACDSAFAWNATRHLAKSPAKWSALLIRIGLTGCRDEGTGTIHENEPTQAVFFRTQDLKVIDVIRNVPGKRETMIGPVEKIFQDPGSEESEYEMGYELDRELEYLNWAARDPTAWTFESDALARILNIYRSLSLSRIHHPAQFVAIKDRARAAVAGVLADETPLEVKKVLEKIYRMTSGSRQSQA